MSHRSSTLLLSLPPIHAFGFFPLKTDFFFFLIFPKELANREIQTECVCAVVTYIAKTTFLLEKVFALFLLFPLFLSYKHKGFKN